MIQRRDLSAPRRKSTGRVAQAYGPVTVIMSPLSRRGVSAMSRASIPRAFLPVAGPTTISVPSVPAGAIGMTAFGRG
jgi:hypothetical protein